MRGRRLAVAVVVALVAEGTTLARAEVSPPSRTSGAEVARIVTVTVVRPRPGAGRSLRLLATRTSWNGGPQQLLVLGSRSAPDGRMWLNVRLPGRPNGSSGWVTRDAVDLERVTMWVDVSLSRREVRVFRRGELIRRISAVVGAADTPTPTGLFAVYEHVSQPEGTGFLGPWALHLTAFSNVLENYGGGPGRIAIHGRGGASLADPLGTARSHGCLRVDNDAVRWLARWVVPGTPVRIHR